MCFSIKIHDLSDLKEMFAIITLEDERGLDKIEWTDDGQLLAVTTVKGNLHVYLTSLLWMCFSIKIHDLSDLKEMFAIITLEDERGLDKIEWTDDGQLLAVTTVKGNLHVYLTSLPMLAATQNTRIAHLTSLLEVTIEDNIQQVNFDK